MKCSIKLKSFNYLILEKITEFCIEESKQLESINISIIRLPKKIKKFSLIKSPHVHKKSREQFESINYSRLIYLEGAKSNLEKIIGKAIINNKNTFYYKIKWHS